MSKSNIYDTLCFQPVYQAGKLPHALEKMAQQLVESGRLRINSDTARNFVTYTGPAFELSFSARELLDPKLRHDTRKRVAETVPTAFGAQGVEDRWSELTRQLKKYGEMSHEQEMQVARVLMQAAHPAVIALLILANAEVFVSYSHNVGDLMPVHFWQNEGQNSGLQSVSEEGAAVYVSCGGDPFFNGEPDHRTYLTDGFPALARMVVIAAQEIGHFSDLLRDSSGQAIGRHSCYMSPLMARTEVRESRRTDIDTVAWLKKQAKALGVEKLARIEASLAFYSKNRKGSLVYWYTTLIAWQMAHAVRSRAHKHKLHFFARFPKKILGTEARTGTLMLQCLEDMAFNLAPQAEVYRRADAQEEEAVACIEALARVPQQVMKWGHAVTQSAWPNLYKIYYKQVIPNNIHSYETVTGKAFPHHLFEGGKHFSPLEKKLGQMISGKKK